MNGLTTAIGASGRTNKKESKMRIWYPLTGEYVELGVANPEEFEGIIAEVRSFHKVLSDPSTDTTYAELSHAMNRTAALRRRLPSKIRHALIIKLHDQIDRTNEARTVRPKRKSLWRRIFGG